MPQPKTLAETEALVEAYIAQNADRLREISTFLKDYALKHMLSGGEMAQTMLVMLHTAAMINEVSPEALKMIDNGARCIATAIVSTPDPVDPENDPTLS